MKTMSSFATRLGAAFALSVLLSASASAATTTLVVTPSSPVFDCKNVAGVPLDAAPGYSFGSLASTGGPATVCATGGSSTKTDMYFTPKSLFGRDVVTLGEVVSMSYRTKSGFTHAVDPRDWFLAIYTKRYTGQLGTSFYGVRIGTEPYFSNSLNDPAGNWNEWSTSSGDNQLRFFESTYGYFGGYGDPFWSSLISGTSLAGVRGPGVPYATQPILYFSVQTASAWATGFTGQVDGLRIELTDGSVAKINFEPFVVATDMDSCKKGGWQSLHRADGTTFGNQGDCIQYVNTGK